MNSINNNIFSITSYYACYLFTHLFSLFILWCFSSHSYLMRIETFDFILVYFVSFVLYITLESLKWIQSIKERKGHCSYVRDLESNVRITVELNLVFISYRAVNVVLDREILPVTVETIWGRLCTCQREFLIVSPLSSDKCICSDICTYY